MGLLELAERLRNRELSPVEVTNAQLARIASLDQKLMAFETVTAKRAMAQAKLGEREIKAGRYLGLLHGIPVAVKDLFFTNGIPTGGGLKVYANHVPTFDATALARLLKAGVVLLGKLSLAEGAGGGYHRDFRVARNPWAADRWPGVSSSGSGVATAAGLGYASLATDTGGSTQPRWANPSLLVIQGPGEFGNPGVQFSSRTGLMSGLHLPADSLCLLKDAQRILAENLSNIVI